MKENIMCEQRYEGPTRPYELEETGRVYMMPEKHCIFCKNCTDIFYDYTNGPYMFPCNLGVKPFASSASFECEKFEDSGYVFDEEDYKRRMEARAEAMKELRELYETNEGFRTKFDALKALIYDSVILGKESEVQTNEN